MNMFHDSIDTPAVLIDLDILELNIRNMSTCVGDAGLRLRPHTKVHQCPDIAKMQIGAGACGIEVGSISQAEVMADAGIDDIVIAHPFFGDHEWRRLRLLAGRSGLRIAAVIDMAEQAHAISEVGEALGIRIPVDVKIDTGVKRFGIPPGAGVLDFVKSISPLAGICIEGIYGHESGAPPTEEGIRGMAFEVASAMSDTAIMLKKAGIHLDTVSVGASPTYRATCDLVNQGHFKEITELHPGHCVIGDILYLMGGGNTREACALTVLTTVVSASHETHAVLDAGYKTFGADSLIGYRDTPGFFLEGRPSFGSVQGRADLWLGRLGAETACLYYQDSSNRLRVGDRLEIVPNNATLVLNIHDHAYGVRNNSIERIFHISGRGKGS